MLERPIKVLNVDDDERGRYLVSKQLKRAGFEVDEAADGLTALEMAGPDYDVVLLDVNLPDINGFEVCQRLKASDRTKMVKVIHLSAAVVSPSSKAFGLNEGADAYLTEPVDPGELAATITSIARLRRAEDAASRAAQEWQSTFDAIRDGLWLLDEHGKVRRCNQPMALRVLKMTIDQVVGRRAVDLLKELKPHLGQLPGAAEFKLGQEWYAVNTDRVEVAGDAASGVVQTFTNITARKNAEDIAEKAQRAKSEFLANVTHELRTPLSAVLGYADLLRDPALNVAEREKFNDVVQRNGAQLGRLIDDLLDISKVEEDRFETESTPVNLIALLSELRSSARVATKARGVLFEVVFSTPVPRIVQTDPVRIRQIISNLIGNAVKFTSKGSVRLSVNYFKGEPSWLEFRVMDTGIGLSETQREKIFQPFVQADQSTTRRFGGTGLGLSLSRKLAEKLGGNLWLERSEESEGSEFAVRIPVPQVDSSSLVVNLDDELERRDPEAKAPAQEKCPLTGMTILLAEDAIDNQWLYTRYLTSAGASVITAINGGEAIEKALHEHCDLVLMDIQMPEIDGYVATKRLRDAGFKHPIIALTAHALPEDKDRCQQVGCNGHLKKPVEKATLVAAVQSFASEAHN